MDAMRCAQCGKTVGAYKLWIAVERFGSSHLNSAVCIPFFADIMTMFITACTMTTCPGWVKDAGLTATGTTDTGALNGPAGYAIGFGASLVLCCLVFPMVHWCCLPTYRDTVGDGSNPPCCTPAPFWCPCLGSKGKKTKKKGDGNDSGEEIEMEDVADDEETSKKKGSATRGAVGAASPEDDEEETSKKKGSATRGAVVAASL